MPIESIEVPMPYENEKFREAMLRELAPWKAEVTFRIIPPEQSREWWYHGRIVGTDNDQGSTYSEGQKIQKISTAQTVAMGLPETIARIWGETGESLIP